VATSILPIADIDANTTSITTDGEDDGSDARTHADSSVKPLSPSLISPSRSQSRSELNSQQQPQPSLQEVAKLVRDIHGMQQSRRERQTQLAQQQRRLAMLHDECQKRAVELIQLDRTQPELLAQRQLLAAREQELSHVWNKTCDIYRSSLSNKLLQLDKLTAKATSLRKTSKALPQEGAEPKHGIDSDSSHGGHNSSRRVDHKEAPFLDLEKRSVDLHRQLVALQYSRSCGFQCVPSSLFPAPASAAPSSSSSSLPAPSPSSSQFAEATILDSWQAHSQQVELLEQRLAGLRENNSMATARASSCASQLQAALATARVRLQSLRAQHNLSTALTLQVHRVQGDFSLLRKAYFQSLISNVKLNLIQCHVIVPQTSLSSLYFKIAGENFDDDWQEAQVQPTRHYRDWAHIVENHFFENSQDTSLETKEPDQTQQIQPLKQLKSLRVQSLPGFASQFVII
jgi:hypothetical protein